MPPETLANRVAILEHKMESLEGLPDRVAALVVQIVQFRAEVRAEFSAVLQEMRGLSETLRGEMNGLGDTLHGEMNGLGDTLRGEMNGLGDTLRGEMNGLGDTLRGEINGLGDTLRGEINGGLNGLAQTLRAEIRAGDEETRLQMRVLHEEVIARFALLEEHLNGQKRSPESRGRTSVPRRRSPKR
jgi:hypothetical protein